MKYCLIILIISFSGSFALAYNAQSYTGTISGPRNNWGGDGYGWNITGANNGCKWSNTFVVLKSFDGYQDILPSILLGYAAGKTVTVITDGTCDVYGSGNVISVELLP